MQLPGQREGRTRQITFEGRTQSITQWARERGLSYTGLTYRLAMGWNIERAFDPTRRLSAPRNIPDMTGQVFGLWRVLSRAVGRRAGKTRPARWLCECRCGVRKVQEGGALRRGGSRGCRSCTRQIRPYEAIYNIMRGNARHRNLAATLTYEQYVALASTPECFYCAMPLVWIRHDIGKNGQTYNLDRIDNARGYHFDNVVPCCSNCNRTRSNKLSHEEMIVVGKMRREARLRLARAS